MIKCDLYSGKKCGYFRQEAKKTLKDLQKANFSAEGLKFDPNLAKLIGLLKILLASDEPTNVAFVNRVLEENPQILPYLSQDG
jgi:hypothetical protein